MKKATLFAACMLLGTLELSSKAFAVPVVVNDTLGEDNLIMCVTDAQAWGTNDAVGKTGRLLAKQHSYSDRKDDQNYRSSVKFDLRKGGCKVTDTYYGNVSITWAENRKDNDLAIVFNPSKEAESLQLHLDAVGRERADVCTSDKSFCVLLWHPTAKKMG